MVERIPSKNDVVGSKPTACSKKTISGVSLHDRSCAIEETMERDVLTAWTKCQCSERTWRGFMPAIRVTVQPKWNAFLRIICCALGHCCRSASLRCWWSGVAGQHK